MTRYRHVTGHVTNTLPYFLFRFELKKNIFNHGSSASFSCLRLFPHLFVKFQNSFYACVEEGCSAEHRVSREVITGKVYCFNRLEVTVDKTGVLFSDAR